MTHDRTEQLVREAFDAEAARAADPRGVLATLHRARAPRRHHAFAVAVAVVAVAAAAIVVPTVFRESTPPAGGPAAVTGSVLIVGVDTADRTDSVVLARIEDGSVNLASLPRDTWVQVPGGPMERLNQVYSVHGVDALLATVGDLTGVVPEHYAVVEMAAVRALATAVSGVPVCLIAPTWDPGVGIDLPAGQQTLDGDTALGFLRQRHGLPNGDVDRIVRHQAFLGALAAKLRDVDLPAVIDVLRGHVTTDDGLDVLGFVQAVVAAPEVRVGTIPLLDTDHSTPDGSVVTVDPALVRRFVDEQGSTRPVQDGVVPCVN